MLFSPSLMISSFWFKMTDKWLFLLLEYLDATVGLLIGLIWYCCVSGNRKAQVQEERGENGWLVEQLEYTH